MLTPLRIQEHNQSRNIVTGDEILFYVENSLDYPKWTIASQKFALPIFGNARGFQVVTILLKVASFNTVWFIDRNLLS
jgi:hypothetical protein